MVTLASILTGRPGLAIIVIVVALLGAGELLRWAKEWRER